MKQELRWELTKAQKSKYISMLTPELSSLRAKASISQGDLAKMIGISRQTYSSIECENREMSWNTYLSLILFFDYNALTHQMIRNIGIFPTELVKVFNGGKELTDNSDRGIAGIPDSITGELDDAAFQAIRTAVMLEYARCTKQTGDAIIKSFDGLNLSKPQPDVKAAKALKGIKKGKNK